MARPARRLRPTDLLVLLLALASVAIVAWQAWGHPDAGQERLLRLGELAIVALFALEFAFALARHEHKGLYAARNWNELVALVPVTFGWATRVPGSLAVLVAVLLARFGRVVDRLYGDEAFYRTVARLQAIVVEWVADAVTLRVLDQTLLVLQKGAFTRNLADALEAHGPDMDEVVLDKVRADPALARLRHVPFFDDVVAVSGAVGRRIAIETLRDPRMEQLVRDVVRANVLQIRAEVAKLDAASDAS